MSIMADELDRLSVAGKLCKSYPEEGAVRCLACSHRCVIRKGKRGICQVRFNRDGELRVPWGYVAALQADPIEKKPFSHFLPGSTALTFGMLGCDFHCGYCFRGDTMVVTNRGPITLAEAFSSDRPGKPAARRRKSHFQRGSRQPPGRALCTGCTQFFKHPYHGKFVTIKPYYLPEIHCTADHHIYATDDPTRPPSMILAKDL